MQRACKDMEAASLASEAEPECPAVRVPPAPTGMVVPLPLERIPPPLCNPGVPPPAELPPLLPPPPRLPLPPPPPLLAAADVIKDGIGVIIKRRAMAKKNINSTLLPRNEEAVLMSSLLFDVSATSLLGHGRGHIKSQDRVNEFFKLLMGPPAGLVALKPLTLIPQLLLLLLLLLYRLLILNSDFTFQISDKMNVNGLQ
ncbi:hypothetical protein DKX38_023347 [Salix brachista]|uniref:Uncharacterized protein n=1 Tax=Salix brachista TaxID=2182728 RepID=A0A5N5JIR0_9ROSI|nr:hypothetical protein DKX38_023347 [Salix brachista]